MNQRAVRGIDVAIAVGLVALGTAGLMGLVEDRRLVVLQIIGAVWLLISAVRLRKSNPHP